MRGDHLQNYSHQKVIRSIKKFIFRLDFILKQGPVAQPGRALGFYFTPTIVGC